MKIEVGRLKLEILLSQLPPPPRCDLSPRRSPAVDTGLGEPEVSHADIQQAEQEGSFPFQAVVDSFLRVDCTRIPEQEANLPSQADAGLSLKQKLQCKPPLARSLRDRRRTGRNEG